MIHYTIKGDPRTKKNHQKIVGTGRRCPCCGKPAKQWIQQGDAYRQYAELAAWQFHPVPDKPIDYPVNCCYLFYMATRRKVDGLNLAAALDDILVERGILADDNSRIVAGHDGTRVLYAPKNPRTEIYITKMEENT